MMIEYKQLKATVTIPKRRIAQMSKEEVDNEVKKYMCEALANELYKHFERTVKFTEKPYEDAVVYEGVVLVEVQNE